MGWFPEAIEVPRFLPSREYRVRAWLLFARAYPPGAPQDREAWVKRPAEPGTTVVKQYS